MVALTPAGMERTARMSISSVSTCSRWPEHGPIVVLGRGHSGTRFLAEAFERQGVFIGGKLNAMFDSLTWGQAIQQVVLGIYPQYDRVEPGDVWHRKIEETATAFLSEGYAGGTWGWKIGISAFVIPLLANVFPNLRVIHLIRDGRDVMLSRLRRIPGMARLAFNRKMILGDAEARWWWGIKLTERGIERYRNEFEMQAWVSFVTAARRYGRPLGAERYLEMRYEDMCLNPVATVGRAFEFAGLEMKPEVAKFLAASAQVNRIAKWKAIRPKKIAGAISIGRQLLEELGYMQASCGGETAGAPGGAPGALRAEESGVRSRVREAA